MAERPAGVLCLALVAIALWVLSHPYPGIVGDASVYIGRALADFDPKGIGRDMVFVHDGQSRFSIFPFLLDRLVAIWGTAPTGLLLAFSSMGAWIASLAAFASRYVRKPFVALVVIFVAVLPVAYGAPQRFSFSETIAVPRPFAEALVLLALTFLASGRLRAGFASLVAATLIHPLMALAGWGLFAIVLSAEDWRWRAAFGAGTLAVVAAAAAGAPLLHRLVTVMDPTLKAFALSRSPLLFPSAWPTGYIGLLGAQAASLLVAANSASGRRRLILIAALLVGIIGITAQILFGDYLSLLLVIQGQLWRMAWLTGAIGAAAFAFCVCVLWWRGPQAHIVLALLALAWLSYEAPASAFILAVAAIAMHFTAARFSVPVARLTAYVLWSAAVLLAIALNAHYFWGYLKFMALIPADAPHGVGFFWLRRYVAFPILGLVLVLAFTRKAPQIVTGLLAFTALLLCAASLWLWDERGPFQKMIDAGRPPPELAQAIASRPGEVLWVDGLAESWYLAGRPQWASRQQGISTIFSGALVGEWRERMQFLIDRHLAPKLALTAFFIPSKAELAHLTRENVSQLCARPDAPAWVIAPIFQDTIIPPGLKAQEWRLPKPHFKITEEAPSSYAWQRIDAYAILPCADAGLR